MGNKRKYTEDMVRGKIVGELTGLTIFKKQDNRNSWERYAACVCSCGNMYAPRLSHFMLGNVGSCGCKHKEWVHKHFIPEYASEGHKSNFGRMKDGV
ncbi:hypothetical protein [Klebsiella quasipneumoniae]|uniref:hypothetical protein n=1 Tax=Klebsiella quasipneumoniae TaxID=1463165 RepID=UPI0011E542B7|nr:hypothetical protein [Klebsiella quasipneumoniae]